MHLTRLIAFGQLWIVSRNELTLGSHRELRVRSCLGRGVRARAQLLIGASSRVTGVFDLHLTA